MIRARCILALVFWLAAPTLALAGEKLEVQTYEADGSLEERGRIYIEDGNFFRLDPEIDAQGNPRDNSVIFRADTGRFIVLDPEERDYLLLDEQRVQHFSAQLKKQLQEMRQHLDEMPPEKRKMMEKLLESQMPGNTLDFSLDIREIGPDEDGVKYEVWVNGKKSSEVWARPLEAMGLNPAALELIRKMSSVYDTVMASLSTDFPQITFGDNPFAGIAQMKGFPAKIKDIDTGQVTRIGTAVSVDLDMSLFAPPPGYTERKIPLQ